MLLHVCFSKCYSWFLQDDTDEKCQMEALKMSQDVISQFLAAILNFSDLCDSFSVALDEPGMVQLLVDMTKELQDSVAHNAKYVVSCINFISHYTNECRSIISR